MMPRTFMDRVMPVPMAGCWIWTGQQSDERGYGLYRLPGGKGKRDMAHRHSWEMHRGPIPAGLKVLHKCDVPACVNPDHLFIGTTLDNWRDMHAKGRGFDPGAMHRAKTHCPQGHAYDEANTNLYQGRRYCRTCVRKRAGEWNRANKGKRHG